MKKAAGLAAALAAMLLPFAATAKISDDARPIAEAMLGRALADDELELGDRELWQKVASADELLADWIFADEKLGVRVTPLSVTNAPARLRGAMRSAGVKAGDSRCDWKAMLDEYRALCSARRARRLKNLAGRFPRWVFCRHYTMGGSFYAYTEALSDARGERWMPKIWSALCMMEASADGFWKETVLAECEGGCFRDAEVTVDGKRILYSFKASDRGDDFHLYEMEIATGKVRQLTFGAGFADYEPCALPDGSILFDSTRCVQVVDCAFADVSNIYRCDSNGRNMRRVTYDQVHDNYPTLGSDGAIAYLRWEYSDRSQLYPQILFRMNPVGTAQRAVYGENSWFPTSLLHSRAIPGSPMYFSIASGHHIHQAGQLVRIDPREGRQEGVGVYDVTKNGLVKSQYERVDWGGQKDAMACYPYPLSERELLVSYLPEGWPMRTVDHGKRTEVNRWASFEKFGLYWMDAETGERELLLPRFSARSAPGRAVPVASRGPFPAAASPVDRSRRTGNFFVHDVYEGLAMKGVSRGTVKTLRAVALDYRSIGIGQNGNNGPGGGAIVTTPVSIGRGTWDPKIVLGDVPVEADGSASFEAPANTPVYFMLLDGNGRMVQTMRSWTVLMPGETGTCTGCHEGQNAAPPAANVRAAASTKPVRKLENPFGEVRGFSFPRDVQPILDRRCVKCHSQSGGRKPDLSGETVDDPIAKRRWTRSYIALTGAERKPKGQGDEFFIAPADGKLVNWINAASEPTILKPYSAGSNRSELFSRVLDGKHGAGVTDAEKRILAAWVDLCVPYCGTYDEANLWSPEELEAYRKSLEKRARALDGVAPEGN